MMSASTSVRLYVALPVVTRRHPSSQSSPVVTCRYLSSPVHSPTRFKQAGNRDRQFPRDGRVADERAHGRDLGEVVEVVRQKHGGQRGNSGRHVGIAEEPVSYTHLRAHETPEHLVCR